MISIGRFSLICLLFFFACPQISWAASEQEPNCAKVITEAHLKPEANEMSHPIKEGYARLLEIEAKLLTKRQKRNIEQIKKRLKEITEKLDHMPNSERKRQVSALFIKWEAATQRLPKILAAYEKLENKHKSYFQETLQAVISTLAIHTMQLIEEASLETTDFARFHKILDEINSFDQQRPEVSFYQIRKQVTARFSIQEYIECRI